MGGASRLVPEESWSAPGRPLQRRVEPTQGAPCGSAEAASSETVFQNRRILHGARSGNPMQPPGVAFSPRGRGFSARESAVLFQLGGERRSQLESN